jgi:hypothetical protein
MTTKKATATPSKQTLARRRNAASRQERVLAEGGKQINMLLEARVAKALEKLQHSTGLPATKVVAGLLTYGVANLRAVRAHLKSVNPQPAKRVAARKS